MTVMGGAGSSTMAQGRGPGAPLKGPLLDADTVHAVAVEARRTGTGRLAPVQPAEVTPGARQQGALTRGTAGVPRDPDGLTRPVTGSNPPGVVSRQALAVRALAAPTGRELGRA
ncbi:hypothetical protein [Deinococcus navajonensis]|uniref:Uncharacterized protein n=1 Tax=Deinococcus navajonensis TaxID=309884 RepID=A0ABV8XLA1_9DEIO